MSYTTARSNDKSNGATVPCCASCVSSTSSHLDVMKAGLAADEEEADSDDDDDMMADVDGRARTSLEETARIEVRSGKYLNWRQPMPVQVHALGSPSKADVAGSVSRRGFPSISVREVEEDTSLLLLLTSSGIPSKSNASATGSPSTSAMSC